MSEKRQKVIGKFILFGSIFLVLIACVLVIFLGEKNTVAMENDNFTTIDCHDEDENDEIECSIVLTSNSVLAQGFSANIKNSDDIVFEKFEALDGWQSYNADSNGFAIVNLDGLNDSKEVAKLKYKYKSSDKSDYYVDLINVNISDGNETYHLNGVSSDAERKVENFNNDISVNGKTGDELIIVAFACVILTIAFSIFYFVNKKRKNKC